LLAENSRVAKCPTRGVVIAFLSRSHREMVFHLFLQFLL
jgi:hypothetical protein